MKITSTQLTHKDNADFRLAFNKLARKVIASDGFDLQFCYMSDLIHDAIHMSNMADQETCYIAVTTCGTHLNKEKDAPLFRKIGELVSVLEVTCSHPEAEWLDRNWRFKDISEIIK